MVEVVMEVAEEAAEATAEMALAAADLVWSLRLLRVS